MGAACTTAEMLREVASMSQLACQWPIRFSCCVHVSTVRLSEHDAASRHVACHSRKHCDAPSAGSGHHRVLHVYLPVNKTAAAQKLRLDLLQPTGSPGQGAHQVEVLRLQQVHHSQGQHLLQRRS